MQLPKRKISPKDQDAVFWLKTKNYPLEAIFSAAYVFIDRAYIYLDGDPEKEIMVRLRSKEKADKKKLEVLEGEFLNELLNFLLRVEIARNNQKIREYIVASALVSSLPENLSEQPNVENDQSAGDWRDDPLGIATSWEDAQPAPKKREKKAKKK